LSAWPGVLVFQLRVVVELRHDAWRQGICPPLKGSLAWLHRRWSRRSGWGRGHRWVCRRWDCRSCNSHRWDRSCCYRACRHLRQLLGRRSRNDLETGKQRWPVHRGLRSLSCCLRRKCTALSSARLAIVAAIGAPLFLRSPWSWRRSCVAPAPWVVGAGRQPAKTIIVEVAERRHASLV